MPVLAASTSVGSCRPIVSDWQDSGCALLQPQYASYADAGLTGPVGAMLTSIQKTLDSKDYRRVDRTN